MSTGKIRLLDANANRRASCLAGMKKVMNNLNIDSWNIVQGGVDGLEKMLEVLREIQNKKIIDEGRKEIEEKIEGCAYIPIGLVGINDFVIKLSKTKDNYIAEILSYNSDKRCSSCKSFASFDVL